MSEEEWKFEAATGAVIAHHSSGFIVRLSKRLGESARVLAGADGLAHKERARLIHASRRAFEKLHGREVWADKRGRAFNTT
jgi:hypothetical protein